MLVEVYLSSAISGAVYSLIGEQVFPLRCRGPPSDLSRFLLLLERLDNMKIINLREQYPDLYKTDTYVEVADQVAAFLLECDRKEAADRRRMYYHKAFYSLDREDGIEYDALFLSVTPWEVYERKLTLAQLHAAIASLPDKQAKRINAYYFLGMSKTEIARAEGVNKSQVSRSISKALNKLEKVLKNFQ